jgi:Cu+-exporting ATPase
MTRVAWHSLGWRADSQLTVVRRGGRLGQVLAFRRVVYWFQENPAMSRIELPVEGMTCNRCVRTVTGALAGVPGVVSAVVSLADQRAVVEVADGLATRDQLASAVASAGYRVPNDGPSSSPSPRSTGTPLAPRSNDDLLFNVEGMTCASCVSRVERAISSVSGVLQARVNLATNQAAVAFEPGNADAPAVVAAVRRSGYSAELADQHHAGADMAAHGQRELAQWRLRLGVAIVLLTPLVLFHFWSPAAWIANGVSLLVATVLQFFVGWPFLAGAWRRAVHLSANMDTLVAIGTTAAWSAGVYALASASHVDHARPMYLMDAGMILTFITLGKYLEARAKGRASAAIQKLLDLAPPTAHVERDGKVLTLAPGNVAIGETLIVRPGEKIPLDAIVVDGQSSVDQSWLTGESLPVDKAPGSEILAGTINGSGSLTARVTRLEGHTALAHVVELVRGAQESKTEIQRTADRVIGWFVPAVIAIAAATLVAWGTLGGNWFTGLESMVAVLVVACPCAVGLATPTAILVASGRGAELGILIKEAHALEVAGQLTMVVLDKTGTVTLGKPELVEIVPGPGVSGDELVAAAAAVEELSGHPLAEPIRQEARRRELELPSLGQLEIVPGEGVAARGQHGWWLVGNDRLMTARAVDWSAERPRIESLRAVGHTPLLVAKEGRYLGLIVVADRIAPHSREAIERLHAQGLRVMLLSGDARAIAERVAREVGIDAVQAEVLPDVKQQVIAGLRSQGMVVAMVGDGINDAPALAAADLGIAIGSGSDIAVEAADVVIVSNDLRAVGRTVSLARSTLRTIRQNLAWAFAYNVVLIPLAAGILMPWFGVRLPAIAAAAAMALSSVSVVTNSLLLRAAKLD